MSKMSDMAMTIEELRNAAAAINEAANWLAAQFSSGADATPVAEAKTEKQDRCMKKSERKRHIFSKSSVRPY